MDATLNALGSILIKALPTLFLVLLLHFYLKRMFFKPLEKVLDHRYAATEGARKQAESALENAGRKADEYQQALREARNQVYREQEEQRKRWRDEQQAAAHQARAKADELVKQAREQLAADAAATRQTLADESDALAEQIVATLVERRTA